MSSREKEKGSGKGKEKGKERTTGIRKEKAKEKAQRYLSTTTNIGQSGILQGGFSLARISVRTIICS